MVAQILNPEYDHPLEKPLSGKSAAHEEQEDHTSVTDEMTSSEFFASESSPKISFCQEVEMCEIPSREDMSEDEYFLCFYSPDEIAWMNEEQNETADRMESGKKAKKSTPYRGLEAWTEKGQHMMNQRIFSCVDSVLDEQDKQWQKGRSSTRKIAKASKSITKTSKKIALELAKQDEKDARKVYEADLNDEHDDDSDSDAEEAEQQQPASAPIGLRDIIRNSTIMRSKKKKVPSSNRSLDGSLTSNDLGMSVHSIDSCDSSFWSLASTPSILENKPKKKKRKSKKKSAARDGKECKESKGQATASRRKTIKKSKASKIAKSS